MPADLTILKRPRRTFSTALATGPSHVPRVFPLAGAESGNVLSPSFFPVARMGSPLRACTVGDTVKYYGGDSYVRGGGAASGHTWKVYEFNSSLTDGAYLTDRGTLVTTFVGTTFDFTPAGPGTFSVELHLSGALEGDGVTAPLGFGVRFLKVFAAGGYDLEGIPELGGPNGSLDDGGVTLDLAYRRPDNLSGRQVVNHLMRAVVNQKLFYATATGAFTEYTWQPGSPNYDPEVLFSGLIDGSTVREDARTHEVSYKISGAQLPLTLTQVPLLQRTATVDTDPRLVWVPPTFFETTIWTLLMETHPNETPGWVHTITNMLASDPILHMQRHWGLFDWFDVALDQSATDVIQSMQASAGSAADWLRAAQSGRFGRLWTDRKSIIYCGPDDDIVSSAFKSSPVIALDADLFLSVRVSHPQPAVGQVYVEATPNQEATAVQVGTAGSVDVFLQRTRFVHRESIYPQPAAAGRRTTYQAARYNDQAAIDALAIRLYNRDNVPFPDIELEFQMFPHLDLGQPVTLAFEPHTQEQIILDLIAASGGGPLRCFVTGYSNVLDPAGKHWKTTLRLRQSANV